MPKFKSSKYFKKHPEKLLPIVYVSETPVPPQKPWDEMTPEEQLLEVLFNGRRI